MAYPEIHIIVAYEKDHGIGYRGKLPWELPADLKHFARTTRGYPVVMGRRTWESLPNGALPGRQNIVVSSKLAAAGSSVKPSPDAPANTSARVVDSLESALVIANTDKVFVIGGGQLYLEAIKHSCARRIIATEIDAEYPVDRWFPSVNANDWHVTSWLPQIPQNDIQWRIVTYERN